MQDPVEMSLRHGQRDRRALAFSIRLLVVLVAACFGGGSCAPASPNPLDDPYTPPTTPPPSGASCSSKPTQPGCPCAVEGEHTFCAKVEATVGSQHKCGTGFSVCSNGTWSACTISGAKWTAKKSQATLRTLGYGDAATCADPCDPSCVSYLDSPEGMDNPDAGLTVTEAGLTLVGAGGSLCVPKTCADFSYTCGAVSNGCGSLLDCGTCASPETCGGGGTPGACGIPSTCTNFCLQQTLCTPSSTKTTITGTVYAPNGTDPVPNAIVYIPNGTVSAFTPTVACEQCATPSGDPLVSTQTPTDHTGTFTLENVPATDVGPGNPIPLVIQIGRWRRQITLSNVPACQTTNVSPSGQCPGTSCPTRLPKNQSEGDIPRIAVSTGQVDGFECIFRKMGLDDSEFTTSTGSGRVHFYRGGSKPGAYITSAAKTPWESELLGTHWVPTGSLATQRWGHSATTLDDGQIFVTGGASASGSSYLASSEQFDPTAGTWTAKASMSTARQLAPAVKLTDGRVLVAGGLGASTLASTEIYAPASNTWSSAGNMPSLPCNGSVVISQVYGYSNSSGGGVTSTYKNDFIELHNRGNTTVNLGGWSVQFTTYNGSTWTVVNLAGTIDPGRYYLIKGAGGATGTNVLPAADLTPGALPNIGTTRGKVALVSSTTALSGSCPSGGAIVDMIGWGSSVNCYEASPEGSTDRNKSVARNGSGCDDTNHNANDFAIVTNPVARNSATAAATCACAAAGTEPRAGFTLTRLSDGRVLGVGGRSTVTKTAVLYNPASNTWTNAASLANTRGMHVASILPDGKVLVTGGGTAVTEVYDPVANTWTTKASMSSNRTEATATLLANGKVIVIGGANGTSSLASTQIYDPVANTWADGPSMWAERRAHTATLLPDGKVYVSGGYNNDSVYLANTQTYDPVSNSWLSEDGGLVTGRWYHTMNLLPDGKLLAVGGKDGSSVFSSAEKSGTAARLPNYDMVLFACQGEDYAWSSGRVQADGDTGLENDNDGTNSSDGLHRVFQKNLDDYVNTGGRMFATHFNYTWLYSNGGTYSSSLVGSASWDFSGSSPDPDPQTGYIDTSFSKGATLANWLHLLYPTGTHGEISINTLRNDFSSTISPSQSWLTLGSGQQMHFSFNTPIGVPAENQCGRVVYSDFHVYDADDNSGDAFPNECGVGFSEQERLLEYMMFDLAACVSPDQPFVPPCVPISCSAQGLSCGPAGDGCGNTLDCGSCTLPATCGGGGDPGVCGTPTAYYDASFTRDYDATTLCPADHSPVWRLWSWAASTPSGTHLHFIVQTASSTAGLATAPSDTLLFTPSIGPAALLSTVNWTGLPNGAAVAHAANEPTVGMPSTELGSASPDATLAANGRLRTEPYLRMTVYLGASADHKFAPTLMSWDMQVDCVPNQ